VEILWAASCPVTAATGEGAAVAEPKLEPNVEPLLLPPLVSGSFASFLFGALAAAAEGAFDSVTWATLDVSGHAGADCRSLLPSIVAGDNMVGAAVAAAVGDSAQTATVCWCGSCSSLGGRL